MIFELFIAFSILSFILIFLGYYTNPSIKILAVLGFITLFFLGLLLQFNGVTMKSGSTDTYLYVCQACTGTTNPVISAANSTQEVSSINTVYNYTTIEDSTSKWIGRWLSIVSALGVALVFMSNKESEEA